MSNCLVTTLKDSVNDDNLLKIDEVSFTVNSSRITPILFGWDNSVHNLKIIGDGYFTNSNGSTNLGKNIEVSPNTALYLSPGEYDVVISAKDKLASIDVFGDPSSFDSIEFDLSKVLGLSNMQVIRLDNSSRVSGDIKYLAYANLLRRVKLRNNNNKVTGKISDIANALSEKMLSFQISFNSNITGTLTDLIRMMRNTETLEYLNVDECPGITGNISALTSRPALKEVYLRGTGVTGNISSLTPMTNLVSLNVSSTALTGDTSSLANLTNLTIFLYANTAITGTWPLV